MVVGGRDVILKLPFRKRSRPNTWRRTIKEDTPTAMPFRIKSAPKRTSTNHLSHWSIHQCALYWSVPLSFVFYNNRIGQYADDWLFVVKVKKLIGPMIWPIEFELIADVRAMVSWTVPTPTPILTAKKTRSVSSYWLKISSGFGLQAFPLEKLLCNCSETALKPLWNRSKTALQLIMLWNCSKTALKLLWNCY